VELLLAMCEADLEAGLDRATIEALVAGATPEQALLSPGRPQNPSALKRLAELAESNRLLSQDTEVPGILRALDGRFVPPAPGGDVMRNPAVLPTGRNLHGFDPFRIPSAYAVRDAARQTVRLLDRHAEDGHGLPESVAIVLWGTDNLKTEGAPLAQALALMGALPRFDSYGRLAGATLRPLEELGRPRIDVVMTLVGHLPRPDAAADQDAGRSRLAGRHRRRARRPELRAQTRAGLPAGTRRRHGNRRAARLRQCRRRLRQQRQHAG
jgi:magnesium chelatase subunit H